MPGTCNERDIDKFRIATLYLIILSNNYEKIKKYELVSTQFHYGALILRVKLKIYSLLSQFEHNSTFISIN